MFATAAADDKNVHSDGAFPWDMAERSVLAKAGERKRPAQAQPQGRIPSFWIVTLRLRPERLLLEMQNESCTRVGLETTMSVPCCP